MKIATKITHFFLVLPTYKPLPNEHINSLHPFHRIYSNRQFEGPTRQIFAWHFCRQSPASPAQRGGHAVTLPDGPAKKYENINV
jgi:hypothetical protein